MITLADRLTLARLVIAPLVVAAYLLLPIQGQWCFWVAGLLCGLAETTDWLDGKVARARREVSDFGKLADPFCDVIYRITVMLVMLLPAGSVGMATTIPSSLPLLGGPLVFAIGEDQGSGLLPFLPVLLMVVRELVAGALRAMTATKGLVLAARNSGKVKAWFQGVLIIATLGFPAVWGLFGATPTWLPVAATIGAWLCAALSIGSMAEYMWVNRVVLAQLAQRRQL